MNSKWFVLCVLDRYDLRTPIHNYGCMREFSKIGFSNRVEQKNEKTNISVTGFKRKNRECRWHFEIFISKSTRVRIKNLLRWKRSHKTQDYWNHSRGLSYHTLSITSKRSLYFRIFFWCMMIYDNQACKTQTFDVSSRPWSPLLCLLASEHLGAS